MTIGEIRRIIDKLPDHATISLGYWTLMDLYGDQTKRAFTHSMAREWVVSDYCEDGIDLSLRTMTLEELYPEMK